MKRDREKYQGKKWRDTDNKELSFCLRSISQLYSSKILMSLIPEVLFLFSPPVARLKKVFLRNQRDKMLSRLPNFPSPLWFTTQLWLEPELCSIFLYVAVMMDNKDTWVRLPSWAVLPVFFQQLCFPFLLARFSKAFAKNTHSLYFVINLLFFTFCFLLTVMQFSWLHLFLYLWNYELSRISTSTCGYAFYRHCFFTPITASAVIIAIRRVIKRLQ